MRTICLLAQKGGTGKTTLCLHLAVLASELGREAAIIDIDPQASASAWKRRRHSDRPEVFRHNADELPNVLAGAEQQNKDLILLDTAPHSSHEAATAAALADLVLIVSRPAILDLECFADPVLEGRQIRADGTGAGLVRHGSEHSRPWSAGPGIDFASLNIRHAPSALRRGSLHGGSS